MTTTSLAVIIFVALIGAFYDFSMMKKGNAKTVDKVVYSALMLLAVLIGIIYVQDVYQPSVSEHLFNLLGIKG
ncbi:hypothetical protein [Gehongia tenuis]|uniref:Uncharacterized protein n=1 Tax=Gehongia tenuis TaxID=2763655 RepID=A0A926D885_9FIRM|nr:hypothetical protein [Gehongia tenuis]MBC8532200.1 hypothetical protein [Gehongia tenuis]